VLTGHCYDRTNTPPYGPWLDLVTGFQPARDLPSPPAAFAGGRLERVTDQAALFADVRRFFAQLAAAGPTFLLLEDLHWADPASLDLLRHVAPHIGQWAMLLINDNWNCRGIDSFGKSRERGACLTNEVTHGRSPTDPAGAA
jgi:hypothetical protein